MVTLIEFYAVAGILTVLLLIMCVLLVTGERARVRAVIRSNQHYDTLHMVMKTLHEDPEATADMVSEALEWDMIPTAMVEEFDTRPMEFDILSGSEEKRSWSF